MTYAITKHFVDGCLSGIDYKTLTGIKYKLNKKYGNFIITFIKIVDNNDVIAVEGRKNGIPIAFSNGNYSFAISTAKYYRRIGYTTRMYLMD